MDKRWLYVVDFQNDFVLSRGALPVPGAENLIPSVNEVLRNASPAEYVGAVFSFDTHDPDVYPTSQECLGNPDNGVPGFPPHCYVGTPGWMLACEPSLVDYGVMKYEVRKNVFDVWADSDAHVSYFNDHIDINRQEGMLWGEFFAGMREDSDTIDVIGVASDFCVKYAVRGFLGHGFNVNVLTRCTAGIFDNCHDVDFTDGLSDDAVAGMGKLTLV